jgi:hypothetical protein
MGLKSSIDWRHIIPVGVALIALQGCSPGNMPPFPKDLVDKFDEDTRENLADLNYQIYKDGSVRAFIITLPVGYCGSAGCQTVIFVEKAGAYKKLYSDPARSVTPIPIYPVGFEFKIERAGGACGKSSNAEECYLNVHWNGQIE